MTDMNGNADAANERLAAELQAIPDMRVAMAPPTRFTVQAAADGRMVWLWLRWPHAVIAQNFDVDAAQVLADALVSAVRMARDVQAAGLQVEERRLYGPDGEAL